MSQRSAGREWFRKAHPLATDGVVRVSRYYPSAKSWKHQPAWAFHLPLEDLESAISVTYCVCQDKDGGCFRCLRVPHQYVLDHRAGLYWRSDKGAFSVFLAADAAAIFRDMRGTDGVEFGQFLLP
jgi:hypothetical protein